MRLLYKCCCGLDVHRSFVVANIRRYGIKGKKNLNEVRRFGTMTHDLLELGDWLKEAGCTHIAIESTGVFWKPIFNVLGSEFEIILVNARHCKSLPGRKTDVKDCQWLCELLQHGLLKASFIPPPLIRQLRDLTRQRRQLVGEKTSVVNRIHKVYQDANIKLSSVISDIMSKSGQEMLERIIQGETDVEKLADCARGKMKEKKKELALALEGRVTAHHRFMLSKHLKQLRFLEELIGEFDQQIDQHIQSGGEDFFALIPLLTTIPGVDKRSAQEVLAEIGADMNQFPNEDHLSSWAGVCPGNNITGGKRKSGKTTKGCVWLKAALGEIAWAASRTKGTYLTAHYRRICRRRSKKIAIVASAHTILVIIYHMIKHRLPYRELGDEYFNKVDKEKIKNSMIKRLEKLGYKVQIQEVVEKKAA
jgi:transposase